MPPKRHSFYVSGLKKLEAGYEADEMGRKDRFGRVFRSRLLAYADQEVTASALYTGKFYVGGTEVLSMGVQLPYNDPVGFAQRDPEWFDFTVGILKGDLLP